MKSLLIAISLCVVFIGCVTELTPPSVDTEFVVLKDVPDNPVFVVSPVSIKHTDELAFASAVEGAILSFGIRVIQNPSRRVISEAALIETTKFVEDDKDFDIGGETRALIVRDETDVESQTEVRAVKKQATVQSEIWENPSIDYVVETLVDYRQVKIIERKSGQILYALDALPEMVPMYVPRFKTGSPEDVEEIPKVLVRVKPWREKLKEGLIKIGVPIKELPVQNTDNTISNTDNDEYPDTESDDED